MSFEFVAGTGTS